MDPHPDPPWIHTFIRPSNVHSANFAPRTSLHELRSANFAPQTSLRELRSAIFAPRTSLRELRSAKFAPRNSLRERHSANLVRHLLRPPCLNENASMFTCLEHGRERHLLRPPCLNKNASMFTCLEHGREPPRPQPCPIYLRAVFQCGRRWC